MLNFLKKADKAFETTQLIVSGILMIAIMVLTFVSVFFRYVLNNSIVWSEEILRYIMMWAVLVGAGLTTREDQHVCMDVLQNVLKRWPKIQAVHYFITRLIVFLFLLYLVGPTLDLIESASNSIATSVSWLHKSVIYASFLAGIISINLSLLSQVPRKLKNIVKGIEDDEMTLEAKAKAEEFNNMLKEAEENNEEGGKE